MPAALSQGPGHTAPRPNDRPSLRIPIIVCLAALVLRLLPVLLMPGLGIGLDDMFQYDMLGRSVASGNGFRWYAAPDLQRMAPLLHLDATTLAIDPRGILTTFRAPLYPAFIGLIYLVFGVGSDRFFAVRLAQAALGAALAPGTYWAAKLVLGPEGEGHTGNATDRAAIAAAWVVATYPVLLVYPLALASENVFVLLLVAAVVVLLDLGRRTRAAEPGAVALHVGALEAGLAGGLLGLSALTRSVILPFAVAAPLWIAFGLKRRRLALIAALALLVTILPWIVRNSLVAGTPTGIESSLGYNLYLGYNPESTGTFAYGPSLDLLSILNDSRRDQVGAERAFAFMAQDPARFPTLILNRLGYFFDFDLRGFIYFYTNDFLGSIPPLPLVIVLALLILPFGIVAVSAALGINTMPGGPRPSLLLLLFGSYLLPHVLILSEERFHLAMVPIMAIWAAAFWIRRPALGRFSSLGLGLAASIIALLLVNWGLELARDGSTLLALLGPNGNQLYLPY